MLTTNYFQFYKQVAWCRQQEKKYDPSSHVSSGTILFVRMILSIVLIYYFFVNNLVIYLYFTCYLFQRNYCNDVCIFKRQNSLIFFLLLVNHILHILSYNILLLLFYLNIFIRFKLQIYLILLQSAIIKCFLYVIDILIKTYFSTICVKCIIEKCREEKL